MAVLSREHNGLTYNAQSAVGGNMGIGFVLMIWVVIGLIAAAIGGVMLAGIATVLTMRVQKRRWAAVITAFLFPFLCVAWFLAAFIAQGLINETVFHRDPGLGDSWHAPLPDGYVVAFIDVMDYGTLYDPVIAERDHGTADGQEGTINDVQTAQLAGSLILGCAGARGIDDKVVRSYCFVLDTRTHQRIDFPDDKALDKEVKKRGIKLELKPIYDLYAEYRLGWFDIAALAVMLVMPLGGFILLCWWLIRLRRKLA